MEINRIIPHIYIAHKYTEPSPYLVQRHIDRARLYAQEVAIMGGMPITPGLVSGNFDGIQDYQWWCDAYIQLMRRCDAVFMTPGWEKSNGATAELTEALRLGMPVFYHLTELKRWINGNQQ
jgi:hypothetical protein